ncbi:DUF6602 domain-containing protein [Pseudooceanicola aestuarii]|jgi:hypothetical protein|uniref:DUF6602 domain-containing protein n=1 Tax=Pseudooceanicola aestuarii TaxID=2697319 RepID=UPI0013D84AD9|nr:DUF6602 domain-containing protein [Pseudooceanicola aestuarii]
MTKSEKVSSDTAWLRSAFMGVQEKLVLDLKLASSSIGHAPTTGSVNEDHWISVFRAYLPKRYEVASGFVIDSQGARSDQIDMVIYDKHFTPTLLDQQSHHYIPAEAVYAVFEAKPHFDKDYLKYAGQKAASVRKLHRTSVSIAHAGGKFAPKEPFPILAGIVAARSSWTDGLGKSFSGNLPTSGDEALNCGCALEHGAFDDFDGGVNVTPRDGALVYFLFRLLSKLQSMGTVPAIDWAAYAQILNSTPRA